MKSPLTGKQMPLIRQKQYLNFRKEEYEIYQHFYVCVDSGGHFSTEALKQLNYIQVQNKYRQQHGIAFCDEIIAIRRGYGLPASRMAEVLGFGVNVYRNYEAGEVPSISNARLIEMCKSSANFLHLVKLMGNFKDSEYKKLSSKINEKELAGSLPNFQMGETLLRVSTNGVNNGFVAPDQSLILELIRLFTQSGALKMKWLPLLFFIVDFCNFRSNGMGITGLFYRVEKQMITLPNFMGVVNWACLSGYCNIFVNQEGVVFLAPASGKVSLDPSKQVEKKVNFEAVTQNILNIQLQKEFSELLAEILDYSIINSVGNSGDYIPYDAAFELSCLDELSIYE